MTNHMSTSSHILIVALKFLMSPITHSTKGNYATYELKVEVLNYIINVVEASKLLDWLFYILTCFNKILHPLFDMVVWQINLYLGPSIW
jgi:hypothetical protein